ncbi:MAG: vitamin B12-dependent ribonucleotide reductase [Bacillota bacterium]
MPDKTSNPQKPEDLLTPNLSANSEKILQARYLQKDEEGNIIETPAEMFWRVAWNIAQADKNYAEEVEPAARQFYEMMAQLEFLPNSPTLMNAGNDLQQLSACFVLPVEDSMEGIFDAIKYSALIHKSGGGTGFSFSRIRPKNDRVKTTGGVASGPISFMKIFDEATNTVKQGGKRRGANMGVLRVDHPDIRDFITCKENEQELNNFNISVAITSEFMDAYFSEAEYDLINPRTGKASGKENAREIFSLIVEMAHKNGEPGLIFLDKINAENPTPAVGEIESTNPCGEQPLLPYEACNLGSINLAEMTRGEIGEAEIDFSKLEETVKKAVHFLDNVIDMSEFPLTQITEMVKNNRKIGLGVMGYSDMLIKLGLAYDSQDALEAAREVMSFIDEKSKEASHQLAQERGPFPNYEKSIYDTPYRNATTTTIAPTGSISIIANTSSGIEPLFALAYERHVIDETLVELHPLFARMAEAKDIMTDYLKEKLADQSSIQALTEIPGDMRDLFVTSHDISPEWHVKTQAAFQKSVDNAVSKTINFRNEATLDDVREAYELAYESSCKGITIYRDGSRSEQVLTTKSSHGETAGGKETNRGKRSRPKVTVGTTEKTLIGCGKLYITINSDEEGICELFTTTGKGGGCHAQSEAISRLTSLALRSGMPVEEIVDQLKGIRCEAAMIRSEVKNLSCPDAIGRALAASLENDHICPEGQANFNSEAVKEKAAQATRGMPNEKSTETNPGGTETEVNRTCPECGSKLANDGGCVVCKSCGWSRCG